ncbi:MAG: N-acetyltransferase [Brevinematia bacterium]
MVVIREATPGDVDSIYELIKPFVDKGELLHRSKDDILDHIRNFIIADIEGDVVGSMAMKFYSEEVVEFRTLAVKQELQKRGIGRMLVERGLEMAKAMGVKKVFVLTRSEEFFRKLGFREVSKEIFPEKVWSDCLVCPKLNHCDETAMIKEIE